MSLGKYIALCMVSGFTIASYSVVAGGMISGGETNFKPVIYCETVGIDSTHPSPITGLAIAYETGFDGDILPDAPPTVITLSLDQEKHEKPVLFYPAEGTVSEKKWPHLKIMRYRAGSQGNAQVGELKIKSTRQSTVGEGYLKPVVDTSEVEELWLSKCVRVYLPK